MARANDWASKVMALVNGGNASAEPFPGAVCQLVAPTDNAARPTPKRPATAPRSA